MDWEIRLVPMSFLATDVKQGKQCFLVVKRDAGGCQILKRVISRRGNQGTADGPAGSGQQGEFKVSLCHLTDHPLVGRFSGRLWHAARESLKFAMLSVVLTPHSTPKLGRILPLDFLLTVPQLKKIGFLDGSLI